MALLSDIYCHFQSKCLCFVVDQRQCNFLFQGIIRFSPKPPESRCYRSAYFAI